MKNIAILNSEGTALGVGQTETEARENAVECGVDAERVNDPDLRVVRLTPASAAAIEAGDPTAVETA